MNQDVDLQHVDQVRDAPRESMPPVMRWAGAIARRLRGFDIGLTGKTSGNANTDALTLADLTVQELLVGALVDSDPVLRTCRLEAEETTGDLTAFATEGPLTIALDPIDGTKQFRDRSGDGYCVMLHLRSPVTVHYSLVYLPETGGNGTWVEVRDGRVYCGPDVPRSPARDVLTTLPDFAGGQRLQGRGIYLIGFLEQCEAHARDVSDAGLVGYAPDDMPGSIYPLMATGEFAGSLIHSPNIYDFPVSLHIARRWEAMPSGSTIASPCTSEICGSMSGPTCSGFRGSSPVAMIPRSSTHCAAWRTTGIPSAILTERHRPYWSLPGVPAVACGPPRECRPCAGSGGLA